jgi:hypothetical protein
MILCVLLLAAALPLTQAYGKGVDCSTVLCARPLCANPVTPEGECCPSCENSNCKFKGCVNFLPGGGVQWAENPCFVCQCDVKSNQQFCFIIDCFFPTKEQCFGRPVITRPNECCPTCDFGIPKRRCGLVPQLFGRENITVSSSTTNRNCTEEVVKRGCDKIGFRAGKKRFRCQPVKGKRRVEFDDNCPLCDARYTDNVRCKRVRDDDLIVGCDFIVK